MQKSIYKIPKGRILEITCPYCKSYMFKRTSMGNAIHQKTTWYCSGGCVHFFDENWFNTFPQFEKYVVRAIPNQKTHQNALKREFGLFLKDSHHHSPIAKQQEKENVFRP